MYVFNNRFGFDTALYTASSFSVGIHPWDAAKTISVAELEKQVVHENCIAIGECGLDKLKGPDLEQQKTIFEFQLQLAVKYHKPVIIHCVKAFDELIHICEPYHKKTHLIIHGFNKSTQLAQQLVEQGFYLSLGVALLNKESTGFSGIPLKKLFLETDTHESVLIEEVYKIASLKWNIQLDDLKEKIYSNFVTIKLPKH